MFLGSILPAQARNIPEKKQILPGSSIIYNSLAPKHEVRAVWLTTIGGIDWPHSYSQSPYSAKKQQQELCQILDRLQQAKINTVLISIVYALLSFETEISTARGIQISA